MPKLRKDVGPLLEKAIDSLVLGIEIFNRPINRGRPHAVLILLHHSFEMLLKAAILQKTGTIQKKGEKFTYGFDKCLSVCKDSLKILSKDETAALSMLDAQRDIAQHFYQDISEDLLYVQAQAAVTLFERVLSAQFKIKLSSRVPARVLPISTHPPRDLQLLVEGELKAVDKLLGGDQRQGARAAAKLRSILALAIGAREEVDRVTEPELARAIAKRRKGKEWDVILPEVAQLRITTEGGGIPISLRITRDQDGLPIRFAQDGEQGIAVIERDWFTKYNLSLHDIAKKVQLTMPKVRAYMFELNIWEDPEMYGIKKIKSQTYKRYTKKALDAIRLEMTKTTAAKIWKKHGDAVMGKKEEDWI